MLRYSLKSCELLAGHHQEQYSYVKVGGRCKAASAPFACVLLQLTASAVVGNEDTQCPWKRLWRRAREKRPSISLSLSESAASPPCPHSSRALTDPVSTWNGDVVVVIITTLEVMGSRVAVTEATEARLTCIQTSACYVVTRSHSVNARRNIFERT